MILVTSSVIGKDCEYSKFVIIKNFTYKDLTGRTLEHDRPSEKMVITRDEHGDVLTLTRELIPRPKWDIVNYRWSQELQNNVYRQYLESFDPEKRVYDRSQWSLPELQFRLNNFVNYTSWTGLNWFGNPEDALEKCFLLKSLDNSKLEKPYRKEETLSINQEIIIPEIDKSPRRWNEFSYCDE